MKKLILFHAIFATSLIVNAQWVGTTSPITTNSQIGIGTTTPDGQQEIVQYGVPSQNFASGFGFTQKSLTITRMWGLSGSATEIDPNQTIGMPPLFLARSVSSLSSYNPATPKHLSNSFYY